VEQNNLWLKQSTMVARLTALLEKYQREGRSAPRMRYIEALNIGTEVTTDFH